MSPLVVQIDDLRRALQRILTAVELNHGSAVALDVDYYWHLDVDEAYDMSSVPTLTLVGQVSEDVQEMRDWLTENDEYVSIWHELQHVIGVLRALEGVASP